MTAIAPPESALREVFDRLDRHERRMEMLESSVLGIVPMATPASATETPVETAWPTRELDPPPVRVEQLERLLMEAEERLRVAARLETIGRLVAGVAHDFNNLLTVIVGHADMLRADLPPDSPLRETAAAIVSTAQTAAGVTRQLVSFSRPPKPDPCPVDANAAIRTVHRTLSRLTGERVALEFLSAASLPLVCASPGQFDQVLLNLVVNARDAIADSGTVTIRTAATLSRPEWPAEVPPGEFVAVTVTDTGAGMTPEVLARVFDPFFTTKGDRGTGLGLSTVRDIVREARGHVEVESSPGWGTSVRVYWPVFPDPTTGLRLVR
jgi:two-component system cell cycle sensor histidine kinase/response regulator CckA